MRMDPEYDAKKNLIKYWDCPNVLPIKMKSETDQEYFKNVDWQNFFAEDKK